MKRKGWYAVAGVALVLLLVAVAVATRQEPSATLKSQVTFPAVWRISAPEDDVQWRSAEVRLEEDGTAYLVDGPGGEVVQTADLPCIAGSPEVFTGRASWSVAPGGLLTISYAGGSLVLIPDSGKFGTVDWGSVLVPFCDAKEGAWFGLIPTP